MHYTNMENLLVEPTNKTPKIYFDANTGVMEISGRSIPENSVEFYKSALNWIDEYQNNAVQSTKFIFKLEYFNTSSSKCLLDIFRKLESLKDAGVTPKVEWYFDKDDEDMQESGEDFQEIIELPFEMIEIND